MTNNRRAKPVKQSLEALKKEELDKIEKLTNLLLAVQKTAEETGIEAPEKTMPKKAEDGLPAG